MAIHCNSDYAQLFSLRGRLRQPVVLPSNASIEITLVKTVTSERYICNTANGRVVLTDPANGKFTLALPAAFTNTMVPGDYNVVAHRTDGQRTRLFGGVVKVEAAL